MAAPPPSIAVEDQTDEDFFDKLVEDDFVAQPATVARAFSSLSVGDSELASGVDGPLGNYIKGASISEEKTTAPTAGPLTESVLEVDSKGGGTKGTSVKVVQWSAFHVEPQQSDNGSFGFDADFYTENNGGRSVNKQQENVAFDSCFAEQPVSSDLSSSAFVSSSDQQDAQHYGLADEQNTDWENLYPGWKYDYATGQWYQVDGYNVNTDAVQSDSYGSVSESTEKSSEDKVHAASDSDRFISGSSGVSYLQQTTHSVLGIIAEESTTISVDNWNQDSQGVMQYPSNMLFDPQYPGWYYDTNTQKWYTLESYTQSAIENTATTLQDHSSSYASALGEFTAQQNYSLYNEVSQFEQQTAEGQGSQDIGGDLSTSTGNFAQGNWNTSMGSYVQGDWNTYMNNFAPQNMWKPESVDKSSHAAVFYENQQSRSFYGSAGNTGRQMDQHIGFRTSEPVSSHGYGTSTALNGIQGFVPYENTYHFNQPKVEQSIQTHSARTGYGHESSINYSQPTFQGRTASYSQFPHASNEGRSSAGRSPHALVTFGFGGKLIVMKDASSLGTKLEYGSQGTVGGTVSVLNIVDIVMDKSDGSSVINNDSCGYFHALCQQSFPGPLVGGNPATKDVNKWLDERIMNCESSNMDFRKGEHLKLLFCLLKILYQHYGKLRSPFGADPSLEETDGPEAAITKLFASAGKSGAHLMEYDSFTHCMKNLPSEEQVQATTIKVQSLLVSGRRQEAIRCAQDGHMWGPALVLAAQFGEKFYIETVKKMAYQQFLSGSPLRTLCLLIAGQPADVFSADSSTNSLAGSTIVNQNSTQVLNNGMLNSWEENLAVITANRTKDDELVIIHLGDCLWKERGEITAAHTCYLVAEANFESYSDSARLCLIGADHWKCPRTYASPEAIQRTELYEYSKVLGNSQFILLPFQPYKFLYASMLAEVGKVSDSLRYCQASLKSLKYSSRAPEVETWKSLFASLEERLRTHQQGGYGTNLAPSKLVGKFFTSIDRSIHRMIGAPLPPLPPLSHSNVNGKESFPVEPKVASSQSTMAMSSLIPSASVEAINEWTGDSNSKAMHNRSISEPDFGRSPKQASTKDSGSADSQGKASGGPSRFGHFGSQLLQKTMNWVSKSRPDRQAKLGERNKFYYDEKLKRWVEEGAGPPAEEASLPPPPTLASFQSGAADYNINNAFKRHNVSTIGGPETNGSEQSSGIPPIPPSTNQFSGHARMGVWSRYVDTFNKGGGGVTKSFQSLSVPSVKSPGPASFFIPTVPTASDLQPVDEPQEHIEEAATTGEPSTSIAKESLFTSPSSSSSWSMQRFPSMDNIVPLGNKKMGAPQNANGSLSSRTRAASWSGVYTEKINPVADGKGGSPPFVTHDLSQLQTSNSSLQLNSSCLGDDLHEVEL